MHHELPRFLTHPSPAIYAEGRPLFLDFETTTIAYGSALEKANRLVLACWQEGWDDTVQHKWGSEFDQADLLSAIARCDFIVAHNAKFELQWLERCGLDISRVLVYDTMIAEYVIGGNRWKTQHLSLDRISRRRKIGTKRATVSEMIAAGIPVEEIPEEWLLDYCEQDVRLLPTLMRQQLEDVRGTKLLPVVYNRCLLTPVLSDLEAQGLRLDPNLTLLSWTEKEKEFAEVQRKLNDLTGGINAASPKQLSAYLYDKLGFEERVKKVRGKWEPDRTPSGGRKTDEDTVMRLPVKTNEQREFLETYVRLRALHNELSKYFRKFAACINEAGGVLYANFNQMQTATHRLSSNGREYGAQFQNFPRAYKKLFRAKQDGYLVGEVDGSQLEFRAAAHLGRDAAAITDIAGGFDVHTFSSGELTKAGQPTDRQGAKEHTFKPLYGGQSGTEAEKAYYAAFKKRYPGIAAAQREWVNTVLMTKKLETEWGLIYYWPDTKMDRSGYITNTTSICNYPVQGFATAELIPIALTFFWHRLRLRPEVKMRLVNTVHDSLIAEFPPEETKLFHELSRQCMIDDVYDFVRSLYGITLVVPLGCGVKVATNWGATKEESKYEAAEAKWKQTNGELEKHGNTERYGSYDL